LFKVIDKNATSAYSRAWPLMGSIVGNKGYKSQHLQIQLEQSFHLLLVELKNIV